MSLNPKGLIKLGFLIFASLQLLMYFIVFLTQSYSANAFFMTMSAFSASLFTVLFTFLFVHIQYKIPSFVVDCNLPNYIFNSLLASGILFFILRITTLILVQYFSLHPQENCYVNGETFGAFGRINTLWIIFGILLLWESRLPQKSIQKQIYKLNSNRNNGARNPLIN